MRTLDISETPSTLLSDEHQEAQAAQEGQEDPEDIVILSEDQMIQEQYPPLILFPYNLQET